MKTRINQLVTIVLFSFIFLAGNVSAEGTELAASSHEIIEESLELENWMLNESYWNTESTFIVEQAAEEALVVENWMTNENNWQANKVVVEQETETALVIENWMLNENNWEK